MAIVDEPIPLPATSRCKRCGRTLTDHNSIILELGPVCRVKEGVILTKVRVKKANLTIRKPKVIKVKFEDVENTSPSFDFEDWFSNKEENEP
jgi:hypothetical protein